MLHNYIESMNIVNEVFKLLLENTEEQEKKTKNNTKCVGNNYR